MGDTPKPPFFAVEAGIVTVFESVSSLESGIEGPDLDADDLEVFDQVGCNVLLASDRAVGLFTVYPGTVRIVGRGEYAPDRLHRALSDFLHAMGVAISVDATLGELVARTLLFAQQDRRSSSSRRLLLG